MNENPLADLIVFLACVFVPIGLSVSLIVAIDYEVSSERTVNTINEQCGTTYVRSDYFRVGTDAMLKMCEARQKRIEIR